MNAKQLNVIVHLDQRANFRSACRRQEEEESRRNAEGRRIEVIPLAK